MTTPNSVVEACKRQVDVEGIVNCARCGDTHALLTFQPLTRRCGKYTHFCACPATGEPILMYLEPDIEKPSKEWNNDSSTILSALR